MSLIVNGVTLPSSAVITCNGVALSSIVCNAVEVWKKGTLTLKEVVFNASGTFTVPSGAVGNQFIVACTGGGGGGGISFGAEYDSYGGGGGSGRTTGTFTLTPSSQIAITIGAGGAKGSNRAGSSGGTSSFGALLNCAGGGGGYVTLAYGIGVSGGGNGFVSYARAASASNCPAVLTLQSGAVDGTTGLWKAKSYAGSSGSGGGGGCYGVGTAYPSSSQPNTGAGTDYNWSGGSGKVVIWYYAYV